MPDFNRETLDWSFWKTKLKASLRTVGALDIIEVSGHQDIPEYIDDKICVCSVLQSTCTKKKTLVTSSASTRRMQIHAHHGGIYVISMIVKKM